MTDSQGGKRPGYGAGKKKAENLKISLNSDKVQELKPESLTEVEEQSEFSQWKSIHREVSEADLEELTPRSPAQRPPWWKRKMKHLLVLSTSLLVALVLMIALIFYSPMLAVRTIDIEGSSLISQTAVEEKLRALEGVPLTRVTEQQVAELIGYKNVLRGVTIEAQPPHRLKVRLHERVPVAVVEDKGQFVLVDNEGVQLTRVATQEDARLPLIDGGLDILKGQKFLTVTSVLAALPSSLLAEVVSTEAESPSTIKLVLADGKQVIWGTAEESELKAKVLTQLISALGPQSGVTVFDVSSPMRPTTK